MYEHNNRDNNGLNNVSLIVASGSGRGPMHPNVCAHPFCHVQYVGLLRM